MLQVCLKRLGKAFRMFVTEAGAQEWMSVTADVLRLARSLRSRSKSACCEEVAFSYLRA